MAIGYAGTSGIAGASYRTAYIASSTASAGTSPNPEIDSGSTTTPSSYWGLSGTWSTTVPTLSAGQYMYQSDGIYNPATNQTAWSIPYWSSLKVGSLSAITVNTGGLNVTGTIQSSTAAIDGTTMTGAGGVLYSSGQFALGNAAGNITYNGSQTTINGTLIYTGNLQDNAVTNLVSVNGSSATITTSGGVIIIIASAYVGTMEFDGYPVYLYRSGVQLKLAAFAGYQMTAAGCTSYTESLAAGTYTYTLAPGSGYSGTTFQSTITLLERKK